MNKMRKKNNEQAKSIAYHLREIASILLCTQKEPTTIEEDLPFLPCFQELLVCELTAFVIDQLNAPDDKELFDLVEDNRKKVLDLFCGEWFAEVKTDLPDVTIVRTPDNEYQIWFESVSTGFPIKQQYDRFFIQSGENSIELDYYTNADQIKLNNTFFIRRQPLERIDNNEIG